MKRLCAYFLACLALATMLAGQQAHATGNPGDKFGGSPSYVNAAHGQLALVQKPRLFVSGISKPINGHLEDGGDTPALPSIWQNGANSSGPHLTDQDRFATLSCSSTALWPPATGPPSCC